MMKKVVSLLLALVMALGMCGQRGDLLRPPEIPEQVQIIQMLGMMLQITLSRLTLYLTR